MTFCWSENTSNSRLVRYLILILAVFLFSTVSSAQSGAEDTEVYDCIVVGGGLAGLTAAFDLRDENILVLEKRSEVGGLLMRGQWQGYYYPRAAEYIGKPEGDLRYLLNKLNLDTVRIPEPADSIFYDGTIHKENNLLDFLPQQDLKKYKKFLRSMYRRQNKVEKYVYSPLRWKNNSVSRLDRITMAQYLEKYCGSDLVATLVDVENRGLFGASNDEVSALYNIDEMSWNLWEPGEKITPADGSYTLDGGLFSIANEIERRLGNSIRTSATVESIAMNGKIVDVQYRDAAGNVQRVKGRAVIVATPAPVTAELAKNDLPVKALNALRGIAYAPYTVVNLFFDAPVWDGAWATSVMGLSFVTVYQSNMVQDVHEKIPQADRKGILGIYVPENKSTDTTYFSMNDDDLLALIKADLDKIWPGTSAKVRGFDINRIRFGFPLFSPRYHDILMELHEAEGPIILAGAYMVYATIDGAIESGFQAAKKYRQLSK